MSGRSVFSAAFVRRGRGPARDRRPSGSHVDVDLRAAAGIERPVDLVRRLRDLGAPLATAHAVLGSLAETGTATVPLSASRDRIEDALAEFDIEVIQRPALEGDTSDDEEPNGPRF
jgi:hypothetical protein